MRGAGVLAHRQHAAGGDVGVLQQVERDEAVVRATPRGRRGCARSWRQMAGAQQVRDVVEGLEGELAQRLGRDPQHGLAVAGGGGDAGDVELAPGRRVRAEREHRRVAEAGRARALGRSWRARSVSVILRRRAAAEGVEADDLRPSRLPRRGGPVVRLGLWLGVGSVRAFGPGRGDRWAPPRRLAVRKRRPNCDMRVGERGDRAERDDQGGGMPPKDRPTLNWRSASSST